MYLLEWTNIFTYSMLCIFIDIFYLLYNYYCPYIFVVKFIIFLTDNDWKLFKESIQATEKLCSHIYQTFYKISFRPISFYLEQLEKVKFSKETSDEHRLSPREYITQVMHLYMIINTMSVCF